MTELFQQAFGWLETNADFLGAIGTVVAFTTLFFTNGTLILKRMAGRGADALPVSVPSVDMIHENPDYGELPSVACLPLRHSGLKDPDFAHSLFDEIITLVQQDKAVAAAPRTSVYMYKDSEEDIRTIANRLGVGYVLEGTLRQNGDIMRLHVQLLDCRGMTVWSDRMDAEAAYDLTTQDTLALFVMEGIHNTVVVAETVLLEDDTPLGPKLSLGGSMAEGAMDLAGRTGFALRPSELPSRKLRLPALLLCGLGFLGIGGIHRFYVGRPWTGILYLATGGLFYIGTVLDCLVILSGSFGCGKGHPLLFWTKRERALATPEAIEG